MGGGHTVRLLCTSTWAGNDYETRIEPQEGVDVVRVNLPKFRTLDPEGWGLTLGAWRAHSRRISRLAEAEVDGFAPDVILYNAARPFGEEVLVTLRQRTRVPIVAVFHEAWLLCGRVMLLRSPVGEACSGPAPVKCAFCMYSEYDGRLMAGLKLPWRVANIGVYFAYRLLRRSAARRSLSAGIAYSDFMAITHRRHLRVPVQFIPLGINLAGAPQPSPHRPRSPVRFGFVAGGQPSKGIGDVLDAMVMMKQEGLPCSLSVWGPLQEKVAAEVRSRDLEKVVHLRGLYAMEQLWSVYAEMDVALMATRVVEPYGRVVQEARAVGVPTIAPSIGGIPEQVRDGIDGLLYRFRSRSDLTRQMRRIVSEPELLQRLLTSQPAVTDTRDQIPAVTEFLRAVAENRSPGE